MTRLEVNGYGWKWCQWAWVGAVFCLVSGCAGLAFRGVDFSEVAKEAARSLGGVGPSFGFTSGLGDGLAEFGKWFLKVGLALLVVIVGYVISGWYFGGGGAGHY